MPNPNRMLLAAALAAGASLAACSSSKDPDPQYAKDGDTGAAAPATQQTLSPNPQMGDSSQGLGGRTQQPRAAGDSGAKGAPTTPTTTAPATPGAKRP